MLKLARVILKDFKLLIRSRTSAVIVLLGPLILMLLISLSFNTSSLFDIKVATYSSGYSELSESIITNLQDNSYKIVRANDEQSCINSVKNQINHVCAIIPANLDVKGNEGAIVFYVDKTRINIVGAIINSISSKVSLKSTEISTALTNTLLTSLDNADKKLNEKKPIIANLGRDLASANNKVISVESNMNNLNDTYDVNISDIGDNLDKIKTENNLTGDAAEAVSKFASRIKGLLENLGTQIEDVKKFKETNTDEVTEIKTSLESNKEAVKDVSNTIDAITLDIEKIEIKDVRKIVSPISTEIKPLVSEKTHLGNTFPSLLVLVLLFSGILLASTIIINEKSSSAYFRNFITPTYDIVFILGNFFSNIIIIMLQLFIIFTVMILVTKTAISQSVMSNVYIALFLIASTFVLIGTLIGYLFKSSETANLAAVSVSAILLFFSNTILPIETLPFGIRRIAEFNPFVIGEGLLRKILIFGEPLKNLLIPVLTLIIYIIVLLIIVYGLRKATKRRI